MMFRNRYNNHRDFDPYISSIHKNSVIDVQKSYSVALPLCTLRFFRGIFLSVLGNSTLDHKGKTKER